MKIDENGVLRLKRSIKAATDVSSTLNRPAVLSGDNSIAKKRSPRVEILHALLLKAEHIVTSKSLAEVDTEPTEAEGLTPNHFLTESSAAAEGYFDDNVLLGPANWQTCQRLANHFWQKYVVERVLTYFCAPSGSQ
ncbi:hypothetical protein EVAR_56679_1 [Eumeta japonica]|uniref:Uncharacterized protein n=1 Tax=Eumeta variegata TaxID=151549 RepID=A0A4C1YTH4_EUMVA|nr:hypothetical protein EVAR_56679_1 [Eumeta japonica]